MRLACSALLLAAACGNLSNEDVAFLVAIPQRDQLHVAVPANDGTVQPACLYGAADVWTNAKTSGDGLNAAVDGLIAFVDAIRAQPPTSRDQDSRTWGPFPDQQHPGIEFRATLDRELDANRVPWHWIFDISARGQASGTAFVPILEAEFFGAQAVNGIGRMTLHFETAAALGINKPTDPTGPMRIYYDRFEDPRTISLDLTSSTGFGLVSFDYGYAGYADGHGRFDYAFPDPKSGCKVEVTTYFDKLGEGRDVVRLDCGVIGVLGPIEQCWDRSACLTYANDPFAFTPACLGVKPCTLGAATDCPAGL